MAMLDKVVYLNAKNLRPVSLRGNLILTVKKPMRIREIDLRLEGYVLVYFFYRSDMLIQSGRVQKRQFLSQTRSWPYQKAGPSGEPGSIANCMDTDMFSKGNYKFPFQFVVNSKLPESLANVFGSIYYSLRVMIKIPMRYPRRDKTETAIMPIEFVQCSSDPVRRHSRASASSEFVSTANWRNLLYYRVTISHRPPLAIGDTFDISIKVLPIIRERYKIRAIRVSLVQTIEYNVDCRDEEFFSDLVQTEKIPLQTINIRDLQDPNVCKPYVKKMEIPLERIYTRGNDEDRFIVCPTTNSIENSMCHFKVSHQIRVGIVVQEICPQNQGTTCLELGKDPVPMVDPEMPELVDHPRMSKGTSSQAAQDKDDNDFIISTAKMVDEGDNIEDLRYKTVELLVTGNIQILRPESTDGNMPPPTYSDSASTGVCTQFEKVHIGDVDNVSVTIPPAYEETMELLPQQIMPPAYS
ncbi:DEKNAAC100437 [Brettanomyces naardenensis]|uniref:DEKNAAC100437 n=1 Tax=Brettanomyces naardenensis TaxID=13370 RepID=A0A448YGL2_BRENA|nr:DEKNAAC100437 [Brettanomyces naardenensis]